MRRRALVYPTPQTCLLLVITTTILLAATTFFVGCTTEPESPLPLPTAQQIIAKAIADPSQVSIWIDSTVVRNEDLSLLAGNTHITSLLFHKSQITDQGLSHLTEMPALTQLLVRSTLSDAAIEPILRMKHLQYLNLPFADFTDEGIQVLSQHTELKMLRIGSPRLTDKALEHIAKMPSLLFLHLIHVPITDAALPALYTKLSLQSLYLDDSLTTEQGLLDLLDHLPQLHLHINQGHLDRDPNKHEH